MDCCAKLLIKCRKLSEYLHVVANISYRRLRVSLYVMAIQVTTTCSFMVMSSCVCLYLDSVSASQVSLYIEPSRYVTWCLHCHSYLTHMMPQKFSSPPWFLPTDNSNILVKTTVYKSSILLFLLKIATVCYIIYHWDYVNFQTLFSCIISSEILYSSSPC